MKLKKVKKEKKAKKNIKVKEVIKKKQINLKNNKKPTLAVVRICKNIQECDISEISKLIMDKGKNKPFPDIAVE